MNPFTQVIYDYTTRTVEMRTELDPAACLERVHRFITDEIERGQDSVHELSSLVGELIKDILQYEPDSSLNPVDQIILDFIKQNPGTNLEAIVMHVRGVPRSTGNCWWQAVCTDCVTKLKLKKLITSPEIGVYQAVEGFEK